MLGVRIIIQAACLAVLFQAFASAATPLKSRPLDERKFNSYAIEAFIGSAKVKFPAMGEDPVSVSDRILGTVGDRQLVLANGVLIVWGDKYQEPYFQSVIIYDPAGRPRLLAAADYTVRIARGTEIRATTMDQYQRMVKKRDKEVSPLVTVFVRDKRDLDAYLPYLKRWQQANLLGMDDVNCTEPGMPEACRLACQIKLPIQAYLLNGKRVQQALAVPNVKAANIPLEAF